jgi:LysM repeat protein
VASPSPSFRATYRVKSGDTLVGIAAEFNTTVAAIQEANGLTGSDLRIGQLLNIP